MQYVSPHPHYTLPDVNELLLVLLHSMGGGNAEIASLARLIILLIYLPFASKLRFSILPSLAHLSNIRSYKVRSIGLLLIGHKNFKQTYSGPKLNAIQLFIIFGPPKIQCEIS